MSRPRNWHEMDSAQRREWQKADNDRADMEREKEDAEASARTAQRNTEQKARELRNARDSHADEVSELESCIGDLEAEVAIQRDRALNAEHALWELHEASLKWLKQTAPRSHEEAEQLHEQWAKAMNAASALLTSPAGG